MELTAGIRNSLLANADLRVDRHQADQRKLNRRAVLFGRRPSFDDAGGPLSTNCWSDPHAEKACNHGRHQNRGGGSPRAAVVRSLTAATGERRTTTLHRVRRGERVTPNSTPSLPGVKQPALAAGA